MPNFPNHNLDTAFSSLFFIQVIHTATVQPVAPFVNFKITFVLVFRSRIFLKKIKVNPKKLAKVVTVTLRKLYSYKICGALLLF